jgi:hypothetical protein
MGQDAKNIFTLLLAALLVLVTFVPVNAAIKYVDATASGANDGTSWTNAYTTLQIALGTSVAGDEIWVAAGTYKPTTGVARTASFWLAGGVTVYGGFAGGETMVGQRDWAANVTILSGDIGTTGVTTDNSYHVVKGSWLNSSAVLDGFVVTSGRADVNPDHNGGGVLNDHGSPTLRNVTIRDCYASHYGGGMHNDAGSPTLFNVTFADNYSDTDGGGMYNLNGSDPTLTEVVFVDNSAFEHGGGMYNNSSSPTLDNVLFTRCYITGTPALGGGMYNDTNSNPQLTDVAFAGNNAEHGGGMCSFGGSAPTLERVIFSGNGAWRGGGIYSDTSDPVLVNVVFSNNTAEGTGAHGGGMYNRSNTPKLINVSFSGNSADDGSGGGMFNLTSTPEITNTIMWHDVAVTSGNEIHNISSTPVITHSLIEGSGGSGGAWNTGLGTDGGGNIDADPMFKDPGLGNLDLWSSSPAIDRGDNTAVPPGTITDIAGNTRIYGVQVDTGAYEVQTPLTGIDNQATPPDFAVRSVYPNPFNPTVTIEYELPYRQSVKISVYDAGGRLVKKLVEDTRGSGLHKIFWQGQDEYGNVVPSGLYFLRLESDGQVTTRKILLLK